jgi:hypothetical protein
MTREDAGRWAQGLEEGVHPAGLRFYTVGGASFGGDSGVDRRFVASDRVYGVLTWRTM